MGAPYASTQVYIISSIRRGGGAGGIPLKVLFLALYRMNYVELVDMGIL